MTELLVRVALLGVAAGARSSLGVAVPALTSPGAGRRARIAALLPVLGELAGDKSAAAPPRTAGAGLAARYASGVTGAIVLARRQSGRAGLPVLPVLVAAAGVTAGAFGGLAWRRAAGARHPDWQGALVEDAVALTLAALAARGWLLVPRQRRSGLRRRR